MADSAIDDNNDKTYIPCPFCGWSDKKGGEYDMLVHMESMHAEEGESPFIPGGASGSIKADDEDSQFVECPVERCGATMLPEQMDDHLDLHAQDPDNNSGNEIVHAPNYEALPPAASFSSPSSPSGPSRARRASGRHQSHHAERDTEKSTGQAKAVSAWKLLLRMPGSSSKSSLLQRKKTKSEDDTVGSTVNGITRLGRAQLGRYYNEDRMPSSLEAHLRRGVYVKTEGLIPVLAQILEQCPTTKCAYLCHPSVQHFSKLKGEGGFCGYRNIQMLCSYITAAKFAGYRQMDRKIPTIFQIQDFIEAAWDQGINPRGRIETGGIKNSRKYIGTPEVLVMFRLLQIPCDAQAFKDKEPGRAESLLMDEIEKYFQSGVEDPAQRVRRTNLPPIYFQHSGHSLTIVGFERLKSGHKNLLIFDPEYHDSSKVTRYIGRKDFEISYPDAALMRYRRGHKYLGRFREFEMIRLKEPDIGFPAA